ncbi:FecR family protein [Mucilaginibacter aquaedulcis]|uniref:FecR family protein n=1 Tax=Mucilaginibacter aquaedulcis TaxID=1187081 RepID=UPI0025B46015|nr:FecR family protein [Mucilaginibacter aquaedulcis]MDN3548830.1 FecR domain-containing protein [Mucilaginibacter aquaedulcis]
MSEHINQERYEELARKWREGYITAEEKGEFDQWYNSFDDTELKTTGTGSPLDLSDRMYRNIVERENIPQGIPIRIFTWARVAAAAIILLTIGVGGWLALNRKENVERSVARIVPGSNKAILTLANGKQISLTDASQGLVAREAHMAITKSDNGRLVYEQNGTDNQSPKFNTITTPKGGQYWVGLADGTRVLLNAASSLRYPVNFAGALRKVELTGEAYFEVAKDKAHPFIVQTATQTVRVLGTHFNINSYADEPAVKTTLIEGSVRINDILNNKGGILKPGEQAVLTKKSLNISTVDTEEALAWKNGYFMFDETITSAMRKISRWYDVEVVYEGPVPTDRFGGTVNRFASVSQVLNKLALTQKVHFRIKERRVIVSR